MKIAYGVHGYGRGHATRAMTVLPELTRRHEVLVLAGGDACKALEPLYPVVPIPHLRYYYAGPGRRSVWRTLKHAMPGALDIKLDGPGVRMVEELLRNFGARAVISDSDAWTLRAAHLLGLPRISFDHYGVLAHCRLPVGWWHRMSARCEASMYVGMMGFPERVIVSAFFPAPPRDRRARVVGSILRPEIRAAEPLCGEHLLVYFSSGRLHFTRRIERALQRLNRPVILYGKEREGVEGNIDFRRIDHTAFVRDLASSRAVFATAGNQLIGEAMHLGKPVLAMPEDSLEQHVNAHAVARLGIGMRTGDRRFTQRTLRQFLDRRDEFAANIRRHARNGNAEAVAAIEQAITDLATGNGTR